MKSWLPVPISGKASSPALFAWAVTAIVVTLQTGCTGCRVDSSPTPSQRLEAALSRQEASHQAALAKTSASPALQCPPLNASMVPSTPPVNGGHRVTLTWKASAPSDSKHSGAVGYCIYRGAPGDPNPGLINFVPLSGTSCVDDLVANGQRYSYVVRAIGANGVTSITSNPAPVQIPAVGRSNSPVSGASPPLCREPAGAK